MNWRGKNNHQRLVVHSLLQELARRDGLSVALSGRTEKELYPILLFTRFSILEPKYSSFMLDVFDLILGEERNSTRLSRLPFFTPLSLYIIVMSFSFTPFPLPLTPPPSLPTRRSLKISMARLYTSQSQ